MADCGSCVDEERCKVVMDKQKVLMVHNFYQIGGGEHTVFKNEVELLRENGHEVVEYTRSNDELKKSILKMALLPFTTIWSWKTYFDVKKIIKQEHIDIVHCHNTFPLISPSVYYAARSMNVPVIQTIHNFRLLCPNGTFFCKGKICEKCNEKNSFKDAIKNNCYRNSKIATCILIAMLKFHRLIGTYKKISYIFLTEFNKEKFSKLIDLKSNQVFIKPNFQRNVTSIPRIEFNNDRQCKFIFYGRLEESKGIVSLLRMWQKLPYKYILHIYGTGSYRSYVEHIAEENKNIKFFGFKNQEIIFSDISSSVAVLITSELYETFGMSIPESFSLFTPIICTDLGNPKSMIEESKGGLTYEIDNFKSFYDTLNEVIKNRKFYSQNAGKYFKEKLNCDVNYKRLREIYDKTRVV